MKINHHGKVPQFLHFHTFEPDITSRSPARSFSLRKMINVLISRINLSSREEGVKIPKIEPHSLWIPGGVLLSNKFLMRLLIAHAFVQIVRIFEDPI